MGKKNSRREQKEAAAKRNRVILIIVLSILAVALVGALVFALLPEKEKPANTDKKDQNQEQKQEENTETGEIVVPTADGKYVAADSSSDYVKLNVSFTDANHEQRTGDIVIKLRPDCAPITVANFKKLVSEGFYDGTEFFRIIEGFMIQGGENDEKEADYIKGEFSLNGVDNPLKHERGVISMARRGDDQNDGFSPYTYGDGVVSYNSASSGFFIMHVDYPYLNGSYAAFGSVVLGIENVDHIATTELVYSEKYQDTVYPKNPVILNSATFVTPVE